MAIWSAELVTVELCCVNHISQVKQACDVSDTGFARQLDKCWYRVQDRQVPAAEPPARGSCDCFDLFS